MPRGTQSSPTQDLESRFSVFLNPIRDLTKNWEVDIAKYLEEYLEELAEVQITFDGGETLMNFAEAAMLIQGSAAVYSKKVEFLWQMVLQMLDLLHSRRSAELQGNLPAGKEGGGGGKANLDASCDFISINDIGAGKNISMKDDEEDYATRKTAFKFLPAVPLHLVEKEGEKSQYRIHLVMKNNEVFGAKDDFRINRSYLTHMGMLCLDLPSELLKNSPAILDSSTTEQEEYGAVDADGPPSPVDTVEPGPPFQENDDDGVDPDNAAEVPENCDPPSDGLQPMELENEKQPDNNNIDVIDLPVGRYGLRKRGVAEKENTVKLKLSDPWKPIDPHVETPAKRPVRAARLRKPLPCACHRREQRPSRGRQKERKDIDNNDKKSEKTLPSVESYLSCNILSMFEAKNQKVPPELRMEASKEATKRVELLKNKKIKDLLNKGVAQDVNEAAEKVTEETHLQKQLDEQLEDSPDCDAAVDLDNDDPDDIPQPPLFLPEPHSAKDPESVYANKRLNESQFDEPGSDYEALVQKWVSEYITNAEGHVNSSDLTRRVNKWRERITPILEEEEWRQEFDIHRYGTQVLNLFPENGRKQTLSFHAVARNQDSREVSRLFLSCLMLANTYNIHLSDAVPGDFAMDCLELTLLSRVRHHEELEEYAAPSQSSPTKRKGRVKATSHPDAAYGEPVINSDESPPVCADITQITIANNIKVNNCNNSNKGKFRKKK